MPKCWSILCQKNIVIRVLELGESKLVGLSKTCSELKSNSPNYSARRDEDSILKYWPQREISECFLPGVCCTLVLKLIVLSIFQNLNWYHEEQEEVP